MNNVGHFARLKFKTDFVYITDQFIFYYVYLRILLTLFRDEKQTVVLYERNVYCPVAACLGGRASVDGEAVGRQGRRTLELQAISGAGGLVVLQVDGAATRRGGQVYLVLGQCVFVFGHPVAECVSVVRRDNRHLCNTTCVLDTSTL